MLLLRRTVPLVLWACAALGASGLAAQSLPDLRPDSVEVSLTSAPRGGAFTVGVTVANDGPGEAGFTTISVVLSVDDVLGDVGPTSDEVLVGFGIVGSLAAGASERIGIPAEVPLAVAPGTYTLFVAVDEGPGGDAIPEADETNNVAALPFTVEPGFEGPLPDLRLESIEVIGQPLIPGDWLTVYVDGVSTGEPHPEEVYSEAFLSVDRTISEDDVPLGGPLRPAGTTCSNDECVYAFGRSAVLPSTLAEGDYHLIVAAWHRDPDADSTDNVLSAAVSVAPPPLLISVDSASVPTVPADGGPVAVAARARAGIEPIVFSWYAILERPDGSEMGVAFQNDLALAAGEEAVLQTAFVLSPDDPVGEYALTFYSERGGEARLEWGQATVTKTAQTGSEEAREAATALGGVAPNPTAGRALVTYRTAAAGPVRLSVLDVLGREVALLADGPAPAGAHAAALDAAALPAGLYLLRLHADGASLVMRFTVAR